MNREPTGSAKRPAINIVTTDGDKVFNSGKQVLGSIMTINAGSIAAPPDATTIFFGNLSAPSTVASLNGLLVPVTGTITKVYIVVVVSGTLSSNETFTVSLRVNDTTDYTVTTTATMDAVLDSYINTGMSVPITTGDYFEFKMVTPTWTTNPTNVFLSATVHIE